MENTHYIFTIDWLVLIPVLIVLIVANVFIPWKDSCLAYLLPMVKLKLRHLCGHDVKLHARRGGHAYSTWNTTVYNYCNLRIINRLGDGSSCWCADVPSSDTVNQFHVFSHTTKRVGLIESSPTSLVMHDLVVYVWSTVRRYRRSDELDLFSCRWIGLLDSDGGLSNGHSSWEIDWAAL